MARTNYAANVDSIDRISHQEAADNRAMTAILFRAMMLMFFMWGVCSVLNLGLAITAFMFAIILVWMVQQVVAEWQVAPRNLPRKQNTMRSRARKRACTSAPARMHTRAYVHSRAHIGYNLSAACGTRGELSAPSVADARGHGAGCVHHGITGIPNADARQSLRADASERGTRQPARVRSVRRLQEQAPRRKNNYGQAPVRPTVTAEVLARHCWRIQALVDWLDERAKAIPDVHTQAQMEGPHSRRSARRGAL
jgi:hypothetical protein